MWTKHYRHLEQQKTFFYIKKVFLECEFSPHLTTPNEIPHKLFMIQKLKIRGRMKFFKFELFFNFCIGAVCAFFLSFTTHNHTKISYWSNIKFFLTVKYINSLLYHERSKYPSMWNVVLVNIIYAYSWI